MEWLIMGTVIGIALHMICELVDWFKDIHHNFFGKGKDAI